MRRFFQILKSQKYALLYVSGFYIYVFHNLLLQFLVYKFLSTHSYEFSLMGKYCRVEKTQSFSFDLNTPTYLFIWAKVIFFLLILYVVYKRKIANSFPILATQFCGEIVYLFYYVVNLVIPFAYLKLFFWPSRYFFSFAMAHQLPDYTLFLAWVVFCLLAMWRLSYLTLKKLLVALSWTSLSLFSYYVGIESIRNFSPIIIRFIRQSFLCSGLVLSLFTSFWVISCKSTSDTSITPSSNNNLTAKVWLFDQASAVGGGYRLDFQRSKADDPFGLANVRVKFNDDGTISGTDNAGSSIKNGIWKLLDNGQKLTVSGTNVFGIDGTSAIDKLDGTNLNVSNTLDVPQVGSVSVKGVLVHE